MKYNAYIQVKAKSKKAEVEIEMHTLKVASYTMGYRLGRLNLYITTSQSLHGCRCHLES